MARIETTTHSTAPVRTGLISERLLLLLTILAVVWSYMPVCHGGFVTLDDDVAIATNANLSKGLTCDGIRWAFTTTYYDYWHPLTWLSHMLDVNIYGMNPHGHHMTNVLLHCLNVVVVFVFLQRIGTEPLMRMTATALFALHPVHVESVAWVVERKDLLAALFWYTSLVAYVWYVRRSSLPAYSMALCAMALSLMSKPMAVTLPAILLAVDVWPLGRLAPGRPANTKSTVVRRMVLEKVPFVALAVASGLATLLVTSGSGGLLDRDEYGITPRIANALLSYMAYLRTLVWPARLAVYYPLRAPASWQVVLAATVVLISVSAALLAYRTRSSWHAFGWLWYLATLVPVIGLVQTGSQAMADRFLYIPALGVYLTLGTAAQWLANLHRRWSIAVRVSAVIILCALLARTRQQAALWQDSETLFRHTLAVTRGNWFIEHNLAVYLLNNGRPGEALDLLLRSTLTNPAHGSAWMHLGTALSRLGRHSDALGALAKAESLGVSGPELHLLQGLAHQHLGNDSDAEALYRASLLRNPHFWPALNNLGLLLSRTGRGAEAGGMLRLAARVAPDRPEAHYNLGLHYRRAGHIGCACSEFSAVLAHSPGHEAARAERALALAQLGLWHRACGDAAAVAEMNAKGALSDSLRELLNGPCTDVETRHAPAVADSACRCDE